MGAESDFQDEQRWKVPCDDCAELRREIANLIVERDAARAEMTQLIRQVEVMEAQEQRTNHELLESCARNAGLMKERDAAREALRDATEWRGMETAPGGLIQVLFQNGKKLFRAYAWKNTDKAERF